jgi:hypothetical protein
MALAKMMQGDTAESSRWACRCRSFRDADSMVVRAEDADTVLGKRMVEAWRRERGRRTKPPTKHRAEDELPVLVLTGEFD